MRVVGGGAYIERGERSGEIEERPEAYSGVAERSVERMRREERREREKSPHTQVPPESPC
jgi:hypothetical protein